MRVPLPIFDHSRVAVLDGWSRAVDLMSAALVRHTLLFRTEALLADGTDERCIGHRFLFRTLDAAEELAVTGS